MARSLGRDPSISQRNDASCINNTRRKAKTNSNKTDRQRLKRDLEQRRDEAA